MSTAAAAPQSSTAAVAVNGARVQFGGVCALDDVHLSVYPGQVRGLIGPNGAGKSTLVNVLAGVYRPSGTEVLFAGSVVSRLRPEDRARRGLARTYQAPTLFQSLTLAENLQMARSFGATRWAALDEQQQAWLEELPERYELTGWFDAQCGRIPYPVQKLADSVRALFAAPTVLVVDEPAAGLPLEDKQRVHELLAEARDRLRMAVLVIDHDVSMMFKLSDRISVLNGGALIAEGVPEEIAKDPEVIRAYLGEPM
jgi:ABC-type branched-subunit amino acid transport system ATPase component